MATVTGYALRLPTSIMNEVKEAAEFEATSINSFITVAVARRLAELKTTRYFEARAARANPEGFQRIVAKAGTLPPQEGDEIPEGWLDAPQNEDEHASGLRR